MAHSRDAGVLRDAWQAADRAQAEVLEGTTLAEIVAKSRVSAERRASRPAHQTPGLSHDRGPSIVTVLRMIQTTSARSLPSI